MYILIAFAVFYLLYFSIFSMEKLLNIFNSHCHHSFAGLGKINVTIVFFTLGI